jgi:phage recombination protein Bet
MRWANLQKKAVIFGELIMNNKPIAKSESNSRLAVLKNTVAKGLNNAEFAMFIEFCKATGLNPFKREIWAIKSNGYTNKRGEAVEGRLMLTTGFNGFLAIANAHPEYNGMETMIARNEDGSIDYAETSVYRKDRKFPSTCRAYFKEFYKPGNFGKESQWDKQPTVMIAKCSKSHALREAFPQELGGLYTSEEVSVESPNLTFEQINELNRETKQDIIETDVETAIDAASEGVPNI